MIEWSCYSNIISDLIKIIWKWDWTTIGAFIATYYAYKNVKILQAQIKETKDKLNEKEIRKENKSKKIEEFFNSEKHPHMGNDESYILKVINSTKSLISSITKDENKDYKQKIIFYKFNNLFCNECEDLKINGVHIPIGYNFYNILNENCIQLELVDDNNGDIVFAYIYLYVNVVTIIIDENNSHKSNLPYQDKDIENLINFDKITKWKKEKKNDNRRNKYVKTRYQVPIPMYNRRKRFFSRRSCKVRIEAIAIF